MTADHRDLVIGMQADDYQLLLERIASLEVDVQIYRDLAVEAIHALAHQQDQLRRKQQTISHLRDELRRYTSSQVGRSVAA